ncbi:MAG: ligase-associated DNA damage response endonuclease PdeM [Cyclobacteriaceae bacterium]
MDDGLDVKFEINKTDLILLAQKAIFIPAKKILLVADLHLGKVNHFRRSGIAVPTAVNKKNLELLVELINRLKPTRVIFLGDLFHSHYNEEWEAMGQVVRHFGDCKFELVRGNHDIMSNLQYERSSLTVCNLLELNSFILTHEPMEAVPANRYNLAGHIHPGVRLRGKGRQALTVPCFFFGEHQAILPAFGSFTGFVRVPVTKGDKVFIIADRKVLELNGN